MKVELFDFQRHAIHALRVSTAEALGSYRRTHTPQVISFTAPTGAGKTIIMAALIEDVLFGTEDYAEQPEAIFVWLSDSPALNEQSKQKIDLKADKIRMSQCSIIEESSFDQEMLEDGHIYFLNTQKLGRGGKLTVHGDDRQYTIWETLTNTVHEKSDRLYFIIDEAHRGMQGREAGKATSIMQRFLKGFGDFQPMPVVIGMSATTARFNRLVEGTTSTVQKVVVNAADVRRSGLLKDRILVSHPSEDAKHSDMGVLQAAAEEWKRKCEHWYQYTTEQHRANVNPVFVVQVLAGTGSAITDTPLEDCLAKIEETIDYHFRENEVVHTFGQVGDLTVNGLRIPHIDPSEITDDRRIRLVFFKENLSTGWDCPRAETMMSFRHAEDATYIAQLLGRMIRTPLQMHILVDDSLNEVHLYLPYFNKEAVGQVIQSLKDTEGGEIPTVVEEETYDNPNYTTWSVHTGRRPAKPVEGQTGMFDHAGNVFEQMNDAPNEPAVEPTQPNGRHEQPAPQPQVPVQPWKPAEPFKPEESEQLYMPSVLIKRDEIIRFINDQALLTYEVKQVRINSYLVSLFKLARLLSQTSILPKAEQNVKIHIVGMIRDYIEDLKKRGTYNQLADQVRNMKLSTQVYDVFGETVRNYGNTSMWKTVAADVDPQLKIADSRIGNCGIAYEYGRKYLDPEDPDSFKVDVILFASDDECMKALSSYAEREFHRLNDENRRYILKVPDKQQKQYHDIIADGDPVSKHNYRLPETLRVRKEEDGKRYTDHLYVDEDGGAVIKLNEWETGVLEEEAAQANFVCWLRNPPRQPWSLCIPYEMNGVTKPTYPDFIVIRRDDRGQYVIDILEPHSQNFTDNLGKAKGFAKYAEENIGIGRIQLIRTSRDAIGHNRFKRLDMSKGSVRDKVFKAVNTDELDHIFDTEGFFV